MYFTISLLCSYRAPLRCLSAETSEWPAPAGHPSSTSGVAFAQAVGRSFIAGRLEASRPAAGHHPAKRAAPRSLDAMEADGYGRPPLLVQSPLYRDMPRRRSAMAAIPAWIDPSLRLPKPRTSWVGVVACVDR